MKLYLNLFFTLLISAVFTQNTTENQPQTNPYVPGDVIIQIYNGANIRKLIASAPQNFKLEIAQELSPTSHIWLLNFDPNSISHESMIDWVLWTT